MQFRRRVSLLIAVAGALALPSAANAGLLVSSAPDCASASASQVFRPWLDFADYVPAPGSAAESADGWSLSGNARIVQGNEPWNVRDAADDNALSLPAGSSATTDTMCVGIDHPTLRFFSKGWGLGVLKVDVLFETSMGDVLSAPVGVATPGGWSPTLPMPVAASLLPLLPGEMTPVQFRFTAVGSSFTIDDVYVDPWARH